MGKLWLISAVFLALHLPLLAQLKDADQGTKAKCGQYLQTPLPAEAALVTVPQRWPECASYKLYSGIGTKVDFDAARKCAWSERLAVQAGLEPQFTAGSIFGGSAMLTVLYANGEGVRRNFPLALRFACEAGWAPAEFEGRIQHLEKMHDNPSSASEHFDFCSDITSGAMMGFCAGYQEEVDDQRRENALHALSANWPVTDRTALSELVKAEQIYDGLHGKGEIDISGTARGMFEIDAAASLRDSFLAALQSFEAGKLPGGSSQEAVNSDAELNRTYRTVIADAEKKKAGFGAIQPEGIRSAERAWLHYRDAWIAFARLHYPAVPAAAWLTLLTNDRIATINGGPCNLDPDDSDCDHRDTLGLRPLP